MSSFWRESWEVSGKAKQEDEDKKIKEEMMQMSEISKLHCDYYHFLKFGNCGNSQRSWPKKKKPMKNNFLST